MANKKYDEQEGVWRTIGGRRVFIRTGQSLSDAMRESGKFKNLNRENVVKAKQELENRRLHQQRKDMEWNFDHNKGRLGEDYWSKQLNQAREYEREGKALLDFYYDNPIQYEGKYSDLEGKHIRPDFVTGNVPDKSLSAEETRLRAQNELSKIREFDPDYNDNELGENYKKYLAQEKIATQRANAELDRELEWAKGQYEQDHDESTYKRRVETIENKRKENDEHLQKLQADNVDTSQIESDIRSLFIYQDEPGMGSLQKEPLKPYYDKYGKENVDKAWQNLQNKYDIIKGTQMDYEGLRYNNLVEKDKYSPEAIQYYKESAETAWQNYSGDTKKYNEYMENARKTFEDFENQKRIMQDTAQRMKEDMQSRLAYSVRNDVYVHDDGYAEDRPKSLKQLESERSKETDANRIKEYDKAIVEARNKELAKLQDFNKKTRDEIMKDYSKLDDYRRYLQDKKERHDKRYAELTNEWQKQKYGTPEYEEAYRKLTAASNEYYKDIRELREKVFNMERISELEKNNEYVAFDKNKNLIYSHDNLNPNDRHLDLGIDTRNPRTAKDYEMLLSIQGQLSDGIWENSPGQSRYWNNMEIKQNGNRIYFETGTSRYDNPFAVKSDEQVKDYLANKVKQITKINMDDDASLGEWKRDNNNVVPYLDRGSGITVADAYDFYDRLKGRTNTASIKNSWGATLQQLKAEGMTENQAIEYIKKYYI